MALIVSLAQLQRHLRLDVGQSSPLTDDEADLELKLYAAQEIILGYIARPDDTNWSSLIEMWVEGLVTSPSTEVPRQIIAAILMQAAELWGFRGDDLEQPKREAPGDLSPTIKALLYRFRDPALR